MKKSNMLFATGMFLGSSYLAARTIRKKRITELRKRYHLLDEFPEKDLLRLPAFIFTPKGFEVLNWVKCKGKGKVVEGVKRTALNIDSFDKEQITLYIYEPSGSENEILPCLVYYHGGGYYGDYLDTFHEILSNYAKLANCRIVSVKYRTLTTVTYSTSLKDCYQALVWAYENAERLHVDKERIAVGGDSAGGTFAAAVTHLAREWKGPKICYQMLIYPATDTAMNSESMRRCVDTPGWNAKYEKIVFGNILPTLDERIRTYLSVVEQTNFDGLCDAYIEVEENDCLHDDGEKYANILKEHGYDVYYNDMKGTFHGFDQNQSLNITKTTMELRSRLLRKAFGEKEGDRK